MGVPTSQPHASGAPLRIVVVDPAHASTCIELESAVTIGRKDADLVIAGDPFLSARHLRVRAELGRAFVEDLDSTNGVFIRLRGQIELRPGDEIVIGRQVFRFAL
jgi:pSer/pThr/pTyr-binding forkhead associated (FHA) protein